jgi:DNA polymerase III epsilon subunit-like protein
VLFTDTETSSVQAAIAEMYTFGAFSVETNDSGILDFNTIKGIHRYFNTDREVPGDASAINGLTKKILMQKSNGDYLEDCYTELSDYVYQPDAILVGYNTQYDRTVITNNLLRVGLEPPVWRNTMDVMQEQKPLLIGTGYDRVARIKLVKAVDIIFREKNHTTKEQLRKVFDLMVERCGIADSSAVYHTALYDSFCTMMILDQILKYRA